MAAATTKLLNEAMKLPATERVRLAEMLLESADAEGYEGDGEAAVQGAWVDEVHRRSQELKEGSVRALSIEEARRTVASDPEHDER